MLFRAELLLYPFFILNIQKCVIWHEKSDLPIVKYMVNGLHLYSALTDPKQNK